MSKVKLDLNAAYILAAGIIEQRKREQPLTAGTPEATERFIIESRMLNILRMHKDAGRKELPVATAQKLEAFINSNTLRP